MTWFVKSWKKFELQHSIELNNLDNKSYDFNIISLPAILLRDIYTNNLLIENADHKQSSLFKMLDNYIKAESNLKMFLF